MGGIGSILRGVQPLLGCTGCQRGWAYNLAAASSDVRGVCVLLLDMKGVGSTQARVMLAQCPPGKVPEPFSDRHSITTELVG
mgnify:CR=1 FL=1